MLNHFDIDDFLANYWQQQPLLIRNALTHFKSPLTPDELAGLACEEDIESRILIERNQQWSAENGPFTEQRFQTLPQRDWTLLVQAVDHYVPEVAELLEHFRFIPNWRIDDIMISYAVEGGSVGPHYDNYSVFLLQGAGQRSWQLGQRCNSESALQDNPSIRLLDRFEQSDEWVLNPGDILYLPPCYAHWGIGLDDHCITYSIGFRAPSHAELLADFCDERLSILDDHQRYDDARLARQNNPGEITPHALARVTSLLQQQFEDPAFIADWFGRLMTTPKYDEHIPTAETHSRDDVIELLTALPAEQALQRNPASRFAYIRNDENSAILFVDSVTLPCSLALAELLNRTPAIAAGELLAASKGQDLDVITQLYNHGCLMIDELPHY